MESNGLNITPADRIVFLVGSGISHDAPSNLPLASEIVKITLYKCLPRPVFKISSRINLRFEYIMQMVHDIYKDDFNYVDYFETVTQPSFIHFVLASFIIRGYKVISTNFDYLIENALFLMNGSKENIVPIITSDDYDHFAFSDSESQEKYPILKVHGSKRNFSTGEDTSSTLISNLSEIENKMGNSFSFTIPPFIIKGLQRVIIGSVLIVMGSSGNDDFDLGPLLINNPSMKSIIWINHVDNKIPEMINVNDNYQPIEKYETLLVKIYQSSRKIGHDVNICLVRGDTKIMVEHISNVFSVQYDDFPIQKETMTIPYETWLEDRDFKRILFNKNLFGFKLCIIMREFSLADNILERMQTQIHSDEERWLYLYQKGLLYLEANKPDLAFNSMVDCAKLLPILEANGVSIKFRIQTSAQFSVVFLRLGYINKAIEFSENSKQLLLALSGVKPAGRREYESKRTRIYLNLASFYFHQGDMRKFNENINEVKLLPTDSIEGDIQYHSLMVMYYIKKNDHQNAQTEIDNVRNLLEKNSFQTNELEDFNRVLGGLSLINRDYNDALKYFNLVLEKVIDLNDLEGIATIKADIATTFLEKKCINLATYIAEDCYKDAESSKMVFAKLVCDQIYSILLIKRHEFEKAYGIVYDQLTIARQTGFKQYEANAFLLFGIIQRSKKIDDEYECYVNQALDIYKDLDLLDTLWGIKALAEREKIVQNKSSQPN
ncbi:MAG TPA: hypothetical protein VKM55_02355 [Candidatus Lokiarchaeia archaeon]|nr:hypothetical protein [Candidatus Lokiarchaeia archaeon]